MSTQHLDQYLAFKPWVGGANLKAYCAALEEGWIETSVSGLDIRERNAWYKKNLIVHLYMQQFTGLLAEEVVQRFTHEEIAEITQTDPRLVKEFIRLEEALEKIKDTEQYGMADEEDKQ